MSFKLKLVGYFLLVSLLPLCAAGWGLHAVAARSETRRVDVQLEAGLRSVQASYKQELAGADARATALAHDEAFQHALQLHDTAELRARLAAAPGVVLRAGGSRLGPSRLIGPGTSVDVFNDAGRVGTLTAGVPPSALARPRDPPRPHPHDTPLVVEAGRVVAGPAGLRGSQLSPPSRAQTIR